MAATYNELLPTDKDRARALLGDTEVDPAEDALLTDEHILAVLEQEATFALGVAWLADELAASLAQEPVRVRLVSGLSVDYTERIPVLRDLATRLRDEGLPSTSAASKRPRSGALTAGSDFQVR